MIPSSLINDIKRHNVVFFVGAAASYGAMPTAGELSEMFRRASDTEGSDTALYKSAQEVIWKNSGSRYEVNRILKEVFTDNTKKPQNAHRLFAKIGAPIISTNYDTLIEKAFNDEGKDITKVVNDSQIPLINEPFLIKLHGCAEEPDTCVLTERDYFKFICEDGELKKLVRTMFVNKRIVFIGYSVSDLNLRLLLLDIRRRLGSSLANAFFLTKSPDADSYDYQFLCKEIGLTPIVVR